MASEHAASERILVAAVEGGGTSTTLLLMDTSKPTQIHRVTGGPTNPFLVSNDDATTSLSFPGVISILSDLLHSAIRLMQGSDHADKKISQVQAMMLAMSGFGNRSDAVALEQDLKLSGLALRCVVTGDAEAPARCARLFGPGSDKWSLADTIVLISGTGSAAFKYSQQISDARTNACNCSWSARAGGRGHILGDHGSAYWIGREALSLALIAEDEGMHSPGTAWVAQKAVEFFSLENFEGIVKLAQDTKGGKTNIAAFAQVLATGASQLKGEQMADSEVKDFCLSIFEKAGSWLGRLLGSLMLRSTQGEDGKPGDRSEIRFNVMLVGSVWKSWTHMERALVQRVSDMYKSNRGSRDDCFGGTHSSEIMLRFLKIKDTSAIAGLYDAARMLPSGAVPANERLECLARGAVEVIDIVTV